MRSKHLRMGLATLMALGVMVGGGAAIANAASGKSSSGNSAVEQEPVEEPVPEQAEPVRQLSEHVTVPARRRARRGARALRPRFLVPLLVAGLVTGCGGDAERRARPDRRRPARPRWLEGERLRDRPEARLGVRVRRRGAPVGHDLRGDRPPVRRRVRGGARGARPVRVARVGRTAGPDVVPRPPLRRLDRPRDRVRRAARHALHDAADDPARAGRRCLEQRHRGNVGRPAPDERLDDLRPLRAAIEVGGGDRLFRPDGSDLRIFARHIRAAYGLALVPGTSAVLATMNQRDDLGARTPGDWLALVRQGQDWGFPACYGQGGSACAGVPEAGRGARRHAAAGGVALAAGLGVRRRVAERQGRPRPPEARRTAATRRTPHGLPSRNEQPASGHRAHRTARSSSATGRPASSTRSAPAA